MRILELEQYFQSEETLSEVLNKLEDDFNIVDEYADMAKSGVYNNASAMDEIMIRLSGCHSNLITALGIAESEKKNRELKKYSEIKIEFEKNPPLDSKGLPKSFTSAPAEKEASGSVANYRRIRNIIEAYKNSCSTSITTLQSVLKDMGKDYNHPQG